MDDASASSSGFSSDEDDALALASASSTAPSASAPVPAVVVDMVDEPEAAASELQPDAASVAAMLADASRVMPASCLEVARRLLDTTTTCFRYELFTGALSLLAEHWPAAEEAEDDDNEEEEAADSALGCFRRVRAALFAQFHRAFPLTWELFAQWIDDVRAVTDKRRLFELAARDYWSVPLSLAHLRFLHEHEGEEGITRATVEEAMAQAQRSVGLHFAQGHEIWQLCRDITDEQLDGDESADAAARALAKERARRELFAAQMQLPLAENDLAMSEFRAWNAYNALEPDEQRRRAAFDEAEAVQTKTFAPVMKRLQSLEQAIAAASPDPAKLERAWVQYIDYVSHRIAPLLPASAASRSGVTGAALVVSLYERAVVALCLSPTIWAKYADYVATTAATASRGNDQLLALCRRAVRNVSFDSTAWVELLGAMEQAPEYALDRTMAFVEKELLARTDPAAMDQYHFLNVLLTLCDMSRRRAAASSPSGAYSLEAMETTVERAFAVSEAFLTRVFPEFVQGVARLHEYHAKLWLLADCDAAVKKRQWQARWQLVLTARGSEADAWVSFYQDSTRAAALGLLSSAEIRASVFEEGLTQVQDFPLSVADLWIVFEREHGDLESLQCARRRRSVLAAAVSSLGQAVESASAATGGSSGVKRKLNGAGDTSQGSAKRAKQATKEKQPPQQQRQERRQVAERKKRVETKSATPAASAEGKKPSLGPFTNDNTLFVCNLSKEATEEDLRALFADVPSLKDVRLVVKTRGERAKSRGMAYVQFSDVNGVEQGLSRNGQLVHGHPISVKRSEPPSSSSSGGQQTAASKAKGGKPGAADGRDGTWKTDPRTIYVGGLNGDKSEASASVDVADDAALAAAMTRAVADAGEAAAAVVVSRACILKDKHGRPKNYGLVELGDADQVATCLALATHVQAVLGPTVTLKPSRFSIAEILEQQQAQKASKGPPTSAADGRKGKPQEKKPKGKTKGKKTRLPDAVAHERPSQRLALPPKAVTTSATSKSLMPRALRRKQQQTDAPAPTGKAPTPMTNDDFRQLLMKK